MICLKIEITKRYWRKYFFLFWPRTNPISLKFNQQQNQLISAKQPNLIITRNGFDTIVNQPSFVC